jgi:hypothetical protein
MDGQPLEVFISYAHADQALKDELLKHLSPLNRRGLIAHWQDRDISAGSEWAGEIDARLNSADIILLLISPDFLHSDFCYEKEMTRALERHAAGECRVIPVFLRSCDWKGMAFGKLQGVPDDAIPVVSSRWSSPDDAFTRVASAIRQVVERFQAAPSAAAPPPVADTGETRRTPGKPAIESEYREGGWMDDSGAAVLIGDQCYESESVTDLENGRVEVKIAPQTGAEEAALRGFQGDCHGSSREVSFAHRNHGFLAQVRSARSQSVAGRTVWTLELDADVQPRNVMTDMTVGNITADQIATARARLLLLGEQPKGHLREAESFITGGLVFGARKARNNDGIFPSLWQKSAGDIVKFLRWARLSAVFALKTTNICQHVLSLELSLREDAILAVGFTGLRRSQYSNEVVNISASGHCALKPIPPRGDNPNE